MAGPTLKTASPSEPKPPNRRARPADIKTVDQARGTWSVVVAQDVTPKDVQQPEYLGLKAEQIKIGDRVEIRRIDFHFWLESVVVASDDILKTVTLVPVIGPLYLTDAIRKAAKFDFSKIIIEDMGSSIGWRVRHGHDVLRDGLPSRVAAEKYIEEKREGKIG